jgi:osmotically-inducible protein OsmY
MEFPASTRPISRAVGEGRQVGPQSDQAQAVHDPVDIKRKIEEAFRRTAEIDAGRITIETNGGEVILRGTVRSWAE